MKKQMFWQYLLGGVALCASLLGVLLIRPALAQEGSPQLDIVKTADTDSIGPGQTVLFEIVVTNSGEVTATNVTVQDDYDQIAFPAIEVLSSPDLGGAAAQNDGDILSWQLGDLAPGAEWRASYEATAADSFAAGTTSVSNNAVIYADGVRVAQVSVELTIRAPTLVLTRRRERVDGDGNIVPGDTVRYIIRYSNSGTADATGVVLEETFDGTVMESVANITSEGQQEGNVIRWELGTVSAGGSGGEVSYEATLKPTLSQGTIDVNAQATMRAVGVEPISAADSFELHTPLLSIEREREDLNGGAIEPGDTLRFTIRFVNSGEVPASNVVVQDDFDERVVAEVSNISGGGREVDGAVEWTLPEPLEAGTEEAVSYRVRLTNEIGESTMADNTAIISVSGVELARAQTRMAIEPPPEVTPQKPQVFENQPLIVAILVGTSATVALAVLGVLAVFVLRKGAWQPRYFRFVVEGVAVVTIIEAVLVLAMNGSIEPDGAVTILSGTAGYLLGRGLSNGGG